jgi:hypothetical protein
MACGVDRHGRTLQICFLFLVLLVSFSFLGIVLFPTLCCHDGASLVFGKIAKCNDLLLMTFPKIGFGYFRFNSEMLGCPSMRIPFERR